MSTRQEKRIDALLSSVPVMPIVVIENEEHALPLADALLAGGLSTIEITLRTDAALPAVEKIVRERPDMTVGTGTVLDAEALKGSRDAGAVFAVSPGFSPAILRAARGLVDDCPLLPGVATASEAMQAAEEGFTRLKFFPAEQAGGVAYLKALAGPMPHVRFCPTGGIAPEAVAEYRALKNVFTVGGSWVTPTSLMAKGDWTGIEELARRAVSFG
jgi:2-dehydro-3-deoxyphosphogluconate aldolase/(4S)-4-hydroxy-2-oxoglutarate aldolase